MAEAFGEFSVELARVVATLPLADVPHAVRVAQQGVILDSFACALAGSSIDVGLLARSATASALGASGSATLLASGETTTPAHAAFVNGGHVHGLNFDANGASGGHVGLVSLAPLLAAAESSTRPVSGSELLVASLLAGDVAERLAGAARSGGSQIRGRRDGGWLLGQVISYIAAACGAARVLGLGGQETLSALGLALMQTAGTKQVMIEGDAPAKGLYGAFACVGGVLAATLAAGGVDGQMSALEGEAGLMGVFFDLDGEALRAALAGFGEQWSVQGAALKRWPASGVVQPYVDAAIELADRVRIDPATIASVQLSGEVAQRDWFEPAEARRAPANASAAANSVAYGVACALVHGGLRVEDLAPGERMADKRPEPALGSVAVAELLSRTVHCLDGTRSVEVVLADGSRHEQAVPRTAAPLDRAALEVKLSAANRRSERPRSEQELGRLTAAIDGLEELADVRGLFASAGAGRER